MRLAVPLADVPRRAAYLSGGILALSVSYFMVTPLLALYLSAELHSPPSRIGIILSVMGLANQGFQVLIGVGADRWGTRKLLSGGVAVACAGYIGFTAVHLFATQVVCALTLGLGNAAISLIAKTMLAGEAGEKRTSAFALRSIAVNAGAAVGPVIGSLLFEHFAAVLVSATAINVLFWAGVIRWGRRDASEPTERQGMRQQIPQLLGNRALVSLTCASIGFWYLYTQLTFTFPLYANHRFGLGGRVGPLFAVSAVMSVTLQYPAITWLKRRISSWAILCAGSAVLASAFLALALISAAWGLLIFIVVFSLGELLIVPTLDILTTEVSAPGLLGGSFGFASLGWAVGGLLGNAGGGVLYQEAVRLRLLSLFWTSNALIGGLTAMAFVLLWQHFRTRREPSAQTSRGRRSASTYTGERA